MAHKTGSEASQRQLSKPIWICDQPSRRLRLSSLRSFFFVTLWETLYLGSPPHLEHLFFRICHGAAHAVRRYDNKNLVVFFALPPSSSTRKKKPGACSTLFSDVNLGPKKANKKRFRIWVMRVRRRALKAKAKDRATMPVRDPPRKQPQECESTLIDPIKSRIFFC